MEFRLSKGHFLGLFCAVVWGATFISTKVLLEYLSPLQILFSRFLLGYIALWCLYPHRSPKYGRKAQLLFALAGFLGTFLYFLMENVALQHTTASNVGVLVSLAPLFTAAVSKLENPKLTLSLQFFVGAVLSFVGVLLIVFGDNMSLVVTLLPWFRNLAKDRGLVKLNFLRIYSLCRPLQHVDDGGGNYRARSNRLIPVLSAGDLFSVFLPNPW